MSLDDWETMTKTPPQHRRTRKSPIDVDTVPMKVGTITKAKMMMTQHDMKNVFVVREKRRAKKNPKRL